MHINKNEVDEHCIQHATALKGVFKLKSYLILVKIRVGVAGICTNFVYHNQAFHSPISQPTLQLSV